MAAVLGARLGCGRRLIAVAGSGLGCGAGGCGLRAGDWRWLGGSLAAVRWPKFWAGLGSMSVLAAGRRVGFFRGRRRQRVRPVTQS